MKNQDLLPPATLSSAALNPRMVELSHSFWLAASRKDSLTFTVIFSFYNSLLSLPFTTPNKLLSLSGFS